MTWRLLTDFPEKTGRYCVGHAGHIFSDAFFTAVEGDTHYPVGWAQLPKFGPSHWWDGDYEMVGELENRFSYSGPSPKADWTDGFKDGKNSIRKELKAAIKDFKILKFCRIIMDK